MSSSPHRAPLKGAEDARFRTIFEQSPVSTQIFAPDGHTIAVNRAWEELWGVTLDQLGDYNVLNDSQLVEKGIMPHIERGFAGEVTSIPAIRYEPDKTRSVPGAVPYRWVRASIYPVKDTTGAIHEIVLMHEDITEQMRAEEALRDSEQRFRTMFYGAPVGITLVDRDGRFLAVNPARESMLGYTEAQLIGQPYLRFTHPDDVAHDEEINRNAQEQRSDTFQLEKRFLRADGEVTWARLSASVVRDAAGEIQYSIAVAEDITERKRAEAERDRLFALEREARAGVERLAAEQAAILGQIAEGIIITDRLGTIVFVNRRAAEIHGVAALGTALKAYSDTYHLLRMDGSPYPVQELPLSRAVQNGETVEDAEWRIVRPDGSEVVAQGSAAPVIGDDGARLGAVLTIRDVTAQHALERQKDEFLSAVAHDLRTPLTTIKGRIQVLRTRIARGTIDDDQLREGLERMEGNATRMVILINELLDVANLQIGRPLNLELQRIDLVALAREVAGEHRNASDAHTLLVESSQPTVLGTWDAGRLERVLGNLLSNALKYSPHGGEIRVRVEQVDGAAPPVATLSVSDPGIGIPTDDLPYVFERFHRARNVSGTIPGTGIGLSAVRSIVEQHQGTITVDSIEGRGTTFTVTLPLSDPPLSD